MSIKELLEPSTQNKEWSKVYINSVTSTNLGISGNAVIKGVNYATPTIGNVSDILQVSGTGLTSWIYNGSHSITFGGSMLVLPKFMTVNGDDSVVTVVTPNFKNGYIVPHSSTLKSLSYFSDVGTVGTIVTVLRNGVSEIITNFAGVSGIIDLSILYNKGDTLRISISGVDSGGTTMTAFFQ